MADVKWIKIVTDIFDDEKVLLIESMPEADAIIVIWFKLLCMAGKQNNSGVFLLNGRIAYTDDMFATIFRRPVNTVRLALKTFEQFGMIEIINDTVTIPNWEKHQQLDALEASREATKSRVARYREKQKQITNGGNVTGNVTVTDCNADREDKNRVDKNREENIESNVARARRFIPPTVEEVAAYVAEKGYDVDPQHFVDFYTSKGWMVGSNKMKDWKAAVRTWVRNDSKSSKPQSNPFGLDRRNNKTPQPFGGGIIV